MSIDYERELTAITDLVEPPDQLVSSAAIAIGAEALSEIDAKYGPDSENPLTFHDADHSLGVTRRAVRLTNILYPYMSPRHRAKIYDLDIIGGATHDFERDVEPQENERISGEYAVAQVIELGGSQLNTAKFKKRLFDGILATAVEMKDDGEILQVNVQKGSHDPFKFVMSFGDINGIAMEGPKRMLSDATKLCDEVHGKPTLDELCNFLVSQASFLRKRLNDPRVQSDIAYYFPEDTKQVYTDMRKAFRSNILSAYGMAVTFGERRPELRDSVEGVVQRVGTVDKALLGSLIGKALHRKLSH
jgi:hypothetical protein